MTKAEIRLLTAEEINLLQVADSDYNLQRMNHIGLGAVGSVGGGAPQPFASA